MTACILHLTHTDPTLDGRVLKQMSVCKDITDDFVIGAGFRSNEKVKKSKFASSVFMFYVRNLGAKRLVYLPRPLRYCLILTELSLYLIYLGVRLHPRIVQSHDTMVLPAATLISLITGAKLIYDAHELESEKGSQSRILSKATYLIERICWSRISLFISVSDEIKEWYFANFPNKSSVVIYNAPVTGVFDNIEDVQFSKDYLREKFSIPPHHTIFIYCGVIVPGRCIDHYIGSMESLRDSASLVLLGYGYDEFFGSIKDQSRKSANIYIHEPVAHEDVVLVARSADVGLCVIENHSLSDYLSLPNKLFEYVNSGLPVVVSRFPSLSRICSEHGVGVVCGPTLNEVRAAMTHFVFVRGASEKLKVIPEALTWSAQEAKLKRCLKQLI